MCEMVCIHVRMCIYTLKTQFSSVKCEYDSEKRGRCGITSLKWSEDDDEILRGFFSLCIFHKSWMLQHFYFLWGKPYKNVSIIPFI